MAKITTSELGVTLQLSEVSGAKADKLKNLGALLLPETLSIRFIPQVSSVLLHHRLNSAVTKHGILDGVQQAAEADAETSENHFQVLGIDVIRGQSGGTTYKRPKDDGWKGEKADELFDNIIQAHVPLVDEVVISSVDAQSREILKPETLFLAYLGARYEVWLPEDAINLELVLSRGEESQHHLWETYCKAQPNPLH